MKLKQGAMFGLDARIALAIFGALSVISGAALYSAIQNAKVVAIITELKEVGKGYEQYVLDVGANPSMNTTHPDYYNISELISKPSGIIGWNGPYLSYKLSTDFIGDESKVFFEHSLYNYIVIAKASDVTWGNSSIDDIHCISSSCYIYPRIDGLSKSLANAIDKYIDGSVDYDNGNVRVYNSSGSYSVWLKTGVSLN